MTPELLTFDDPKAAAQACGAAILDLLAAARTERGVARLAVSGGSTPRIMFEWIARQGFDWTGVDLFWVDERCVPTEDDQSNYKMTRESLLDSIKLEPRQIHRVETEYSPDEAATRYVESIVRCFGLPPGELPEFDVLQRGMGPDAHTASLFPGEPLIENHTDIAAAVFVKKFMQHRVTLLPGVLEKARHTLCLVTGSDKADALLNVLKGDRDPMQTPSQLSSPHMTWYLDHQAAARL